jgi:hypothetical protein
LGSVGIDRLCGDTDTTKQLLKARIAVEAFEFECLGGEDEVTDTHLKGLFQAIQGLIVISQGPIMCVASH